jgi:hypothetical protein
MEKNAAGDRDQSNGVARFGGRRGWLRETEERFWAIFFSILVVDGGLSVPKEVTIVSKSGQID